MSFSKSITEEGGKISLRHSTGYLLVFSARSKILSRTVFLLLGLLIAKLFLKKTRETKLNEALVQNGARQNFLT